MAANDLAQTSARDIAASIRQRQLSSVEVTRYFLDRIDARNRELNAFITIASESALRDAAQADGAIAAGEATGPLHGVPIAVKDLSATKGIRTTYGSLLSKDYVPDHDDLPVERLRAAGAVIIGKTNTPEYGWKGTTENLLTGACRNPWDTSRTSGGSSGGAAVAVAAGLTPLATGSDAGGSIRMPASFCGVFGIKPTFGRVPTDYRGPGGWRQLSQNGPLTSTVIDAALLLSALAGPDGRDATARRDIAPAFLDAALNSTVDGLRIAWSPTLDAQPVQSEIRAATERAARALADLGGHVELVEPELDTAEAIQAVKVLLLTDLAIALGPALEAGHEKALPDKLVAWLREAQTWPATQYARALRYREWHRQRLAQFFERSDLLVVPTMAVPAFPIDESPSSIDGHAVDPDWGYTPFCLHANLAGLPAASVPCGLTVNGLPIGVQIIGRSGDEVSVLRASAALEVAMPWRHLLPR